MKFNEKQKKRLEECFADKRVKEYLNDYYEQGDGRDVKYPGSLKTRWKKGKYVPPLEIVIGVARAMDTNISYVLGLTDVICPLEPEETARKMTFEQVLDAAGMTKTEFVKAINKNYKNYKKYNLYNEKFPDLKTGLLVDLADIVGLSIDYMLGYTKYERWELYEQMESPFKNIEAGNAAYVVADKNVRSFADIEDAISRGDGSYCLLSADGKLVMFPNGKKVDPGDEVFKGAVVIKVKPEVR